MDPLFVGAGRAAVAGVLAGLLLLALRVPMPRRGDLVPLTIVALGVIVGFPFLTSYAMQSVPASHAAVTIGLLPAATAAVAVLRTRERPPMVFWLAAAGGAAAVVAFLAVGADGLSGVGPADLLLAGAVIAAAIGYAEGGLLSRRLGSWQTVCWALVLALPVMAGLAAWSVATVAWAPRLDGLGSFAYLAIVSMFLGFFAWYRGLGIGPVARVSQVQLVQPVLSMLWAALLLGEVVTPITAVGGVVVIACAALAVTFRQDRRRSGSPRFVNRRASLRE